MSPSRETGFAEFRSQYLALKRKMRSDLHREWDRDLRKLSGADDNAVCTVVLSDHARLRVDPSDEAESKGLLINQDEVGVLGFARGQRRQYNGAYSRIWLLDAETGFYFWAGAVERLPRHLPEYSAEPRKSKDTPIYGPTGEVHTRTWDLPKLIDPDAVTGP